MNLVLRPEIQKFVEDQVKSGNFESAEAVVEAALIDLRAAAQLPLDEQAIAAINEAEAEGNRGEGIELDTVREHMRRRFGG